MFGRGVPRLVQDLEESHVAQVQPWLNQTAEIGSKGVFPEPGAPTYVYNHFAHSSTAALALSL